MVFFISFKFVRESFIFGIRSLLVRFLRVEEYIIYGCFFLSLYFVGLVGRWCIILYIIRSLKKGEEILLLVDLEYLMF